MKSSFRLALMSMSLVSAFAMAAGEIYSNQGTDRRVPALNARGTSRSGVSAPTGGYWSECQSDLGNTTESNTLGGTACSYLTATTGFRLADDFTVAHGSWTINGVSVYVYQTNIPNAIDTSTGNTVNIWNGPPDLGTSSIIATGTAISTSIVMNASPTESGNVFRVFNTTTPAPGTAPNTLRQITQVTFTVPTTTLANGTYWIDYQVKGLNSGNVFNPTSTHQDSRTPPTTGNAKQFSLATGLWTNVIDAGNPAAAPDHPMDVPFIVRGTKIVRDAEGYDVVQGEEFAGDLSSVMTSDDNRHEFFNDASTLACEVIYRGVGNLQGCASMNVKVELAVARPGLAHEISQYNHATSNFVFLSGAGSTETDSFFDIFVSTNLDGYMQNDLRTKIKWAPINDEDATQDGWTHMVDYVKWEIAP